MQTPLIDFRGGRLNLAFRRGSTVGLTYQDIRDAAGTLIQNIASAEITFREGTTADEVLGAAVVGLTVTPTNTLTAVVWEMSVADTRLFDPTKTYWYQLDLITLAGKTWTIVFGDVEVDPEGTS